MNIQVYEKQPEGFNPHVEVSACYLEMDKRLLLLQSTSKKSEPETWGVPAGKIEKNESPESAAKRELFEETGILIDRNSQMQSLGKLYIRKPEIDYVYHLFKVRLNEVPDVRISNEHQDYRWASVKDIEEMPLMLGAREALSKYHTKFLKIHVSASVNAYLVLRYENKVLLQLRQNTGYLDGMWSFVAGHVEDGESGTKGMIREAFEEIGIQLCPSQIKAVHVMHRKTNRLNVDIFFECHSWQGEIENKELEKCADLGFFELEELPLNIVDYNAAALKSILKGEFYSEWGWSENDY